MAEAEVVYGAIVSDIHIPETCSMSIFNRADIGKEVVLKMGLNVLVDTLGHGFFLMIKVLHGDLVGMSTKFGHGSCTPHDVSHDVDNLWWPSCYFAVYLAFSKPNK